ncbi:MAG: YbaB/EbfC family nucleoid-associated protein [Candidatus Eisenbacteria bacterium]|uniref:Nucleoid-associated protein FJY75_09070 n=1 Tax=Eiseniibacteriota bacterium TaxID=2212470 RepID=A0A937X8S4_UNCEI|nr:YbaB/EbfC family nucleoid-associated protein [Candidatus Eisenbacteria bacterium]
MDLNKMMRQLQQTQARMAELQEQLAARTLEATAGGGMVKVAVNGRNEVLSIRIDPQVVDPGDVEMLEDLVVAAVNEARQRVEEMTRAEMSRVAGGLGLPGMPGV